METIITLVYSMHLVTFFVLLLSLVAHSSGSGDYGINNDPFASSAAWAHQEMQDLRLGGLPSTRKPRTDLLVDAAGFLDHEEEYAPREEEDVPYNEEEEEEDVAQFSLFHQHSLHRIRHSFLRSAAASSHALLQEDAQADGAHTARVTTSATLTSSSVRARFLSTGTTIAGIACYTNDTEHFVILGADTRATADRMVADKKCEKIHYLADNIYCCGAGTAADLDHVTRLCRYSLGIQARVEQDSIGNRRQPHAVCYTTAPSHNDNQGHRASVATACRLLRDVLYDNKGAIGANLILGGVSEGNVHLKAIHPHGSMDTVPYAALGSGGLAALAVLESGYQQQLSLEQGIQLVQRAIVAGIRNDLGSGSQVDICIIGPNGIANYTRCAVAEETIDEEHAELSTTTTTTESVPSSINTSPHAPSTIVHGVNGFGNVPFTILRKQIIAKSEQQQEKEHSERWDKILSGLSET